MDGGCPTPGLVRGPANQAAPAVWENQLFALKLFHARQGNPPSRDPLSISPRLMLIPSPPALCSSLGPFLLVFTSTLSDCYNKTFSGLVRCYLRVIFSEYRESEDTHEKSIFLLFHQNIPLGELIQGKIV